MVAFDVSHSDTKENRACVISVLRLLTVVQSTQSTDSTYDKVGSALYGVIEPNLGIFCASIVTLRPLFSRCAPQMSQRLGLTDNNDERNNARRRNRNIRPSWPTFAQPAMFTTSRRSRADKDFMMLSSDLSSSAASGKASIGGDQIKTAVDSATSMPHLPAEQESAVMSSRRGSQPC